MGFSSGFATVASVGSERFVDFGSALNLAAAQGSAVTFNNAVGHSSVAFDLTVPLGGTVEFQSSFDGGVSYHTVTVRGTDTDTYATRTTVSGPFIGSIAGASHFRVIVISAGSQPGSVIGRAFMTVSVIEGIEHGPPSDFKLNTSRGIIRGVSGVHQFGRNPDIDTSEETIWATGGSYTFSSGTSETWHASSTSNSDVGVMLRCEVLDSNYRDATQNVVLNGQTAVAMSGALFRINAAYVTGSQAPVGTAYVFKSGAGVTAGVPNSPVDVRAVIDPADCEDLSSVYTMMSGCVGYFQRYSGECSTGTADLRLRVRHSGSIFRTVSRKNVNAGTQVTVEYGIYYELSPGTDIKFDAATSTNNTAVSVDYDIIVIANE